MNKNEIDEVLKRIELKTGIKKQIEIANKLGISKAYMSKLASGAIPFTVEWEARFNKAFPEVFDGVIKGAIPFYNLDFCLGYDTIFNDSVSPTTYVRHPLNGSANCWVTTRGESMLPLINGGDLIALKEIRSLDEILYGEVYAIVTEENRTIKRIRKGSDDLHIRLVPENKKDFDEQEILKSQVIKVFKVVAVAKQL